MAFLPFSLLEQNRVTRFNFLKTKFPKALQCRLLWCQTRKLEIQLKPISNIKSSIFRGEQELVKIFKVTPNSPPNVLVPVKPLKNIECFYLELFLTLPPVPSRP